MNLIAVDVLSDVVRKTRFMACMFRSDPIAHDGRSGGMDHEERILLSGWLRF